MTGLYNAPRPARAELIDGAAPGAIDACQAKHMNRQADGRHRVEPGFFRVNPPQPAHCCRQQGSIFIHQPTAGIAIDTGRR